MACKVIYISYMHLSTKISRDWYIDFLIEKGVSLEYWDVAHLVFGEGQGASKYADCLRVPKSYHEIQEWLRHSDNKGARYVMLVTYEGRATKLYRLLSKNDCSMLYIAWGGLPISHREGRWSVLLKLLATRPSDLTRRVLNKLKSAVYRKFGLVKPFDIVFAAGRSMTSAGYSTRRLVPINLIDYDHYVEQSLRDKRVVDGNYAVFLDIYLPYHPDLKIVGLPYVDAAAYYQSLNRFFDLIESSLGIKVVIAAHPKADYAEDTFGRREVYKGVTPALVKDAGLVISHHSTSISYAVLNAKPIVFIFTNAMAAAYEDSFVSYLRDFAEFLDASLLNIDEIDGARQIQIKAANADRYREYKYDFLTTPDSENTTTREIFWHEIISWG
jgi:hypothetical protein